MTTTDTATLQRRSVGTLAGAQVLGGVGVSAGAAVGALLAADLSGSEALAGFGGTAQVLGGALCAIVIARVMAAKGRRLGLVVGYLIAIVGALLILGGAVAGSFALFLLGSLLFGGSVAANSQARFAATDLADERSRGRHLSIVVWATTIGAVAGPNLTGPGREVAEALNLPVLAGPFAFSLVGFVFAVAVLQAALRPDPLLVARALHTDHDEPGATAGTPTSGLRAVLSHRDAGVGVLAGASTRGLLGDPDRRALPPRPRVELHAHRRLHPPDRCAAVAAASGRPGDGRRRDGSRGRWWWRRGRCGHAAVGVPRARGRRWRPRPAHRRPRGKGRVPSLLTLPP